MMNKLQFWPPEWILLGGRQIRVVPAWGHSRTIGLSMLFLYFSFITYELFFFPIQNVLFETLFYLICGFQFACAWAFYFPCRSLITKDKNSIDILYMLLHLSFEYLIIYFLLYYYFISFHFLSLYFGSLIFHIVDILYYKINWKNFYLDTSLCMRKNQIRLSSETQMDHDDRIVHVCQNPFYKPLVSFVLWVLIIFLAIATKLLEMAAPLELWIAVAIMNYIFIGVLLPIAGLAGNSEVALRLRKGKPDNTVILLVTSALFILSILINYFVYKIVLYAIIYSIILSVSYYITGKTVIKKIYTFAEQSEKR